MDWKYWVDRLAARLGYVSAKELEYQKAELELAVELTRVNLRAAVEPEIHILVRGATGDEAILVTPQLRDALADDDEVLVRDLLSGRRLLVYRCADDHVRWTSNGEWVRAFVELLRTARI